MALRLTEQKRDWAQSSREGWSWRKIKAETIYNRDLQHSREKKQENIPEAQVAFEEDEQSRCFSKEKSHSYKKIALF